MKKSIVLLFLTLFLTSAAATPSAVFEMDASDGAMMVISEIVDFDADSVSITGSADGSDMMVMQGTMTDSNALDDPDYSLEVTSSASSASVDFSLYGSIIQEFLTLMGEFDATIATSVSGGVLTIDISATMSKTAFEELFLMDVALIEADPQGFKADLESLFNEVFANLTLPQKPQMSITQFSMSGTDTVQIQTAMSITGWNDFMATLAAMSYQTDAIQSSFINCMGLSANDVALSILTSDSATTTTLSSSGGSISGRMEITASEGNALSSVMLESLNAEISKSGAVTDISASASVSDTQTLLKCIMQGYLPGDYEIGNIEYGLAKSSGQDGAMQRISGGLKSLATASGGNRVVTFPAVATESMSITVKTPAGMSVLSVVGGEGSGSSATSTPGEEFTVTYGKVSGFDTNLIIIIVVVVLALLLLSRKKKPKK